MFVAKVIDGQIVDSGNLAEMFPDTSFPSSGPDQDWLDGASLKIVRTWKEHTPQTERLESAPPYVEGEEVYGVIVVPKSQAEIDGDTASAAARVRSARNERLSKSDWTQLGDAPLSAEEKQEWAAYRQALRDISSQEGFPFQVEFPLAPGEQPPQIGPV